MQKCKSTECNHCSHNDIPDFCRKWNTTTSTLDKIKEVFKKPVETIFDLENVYNNVKQILDEDEKTT